MKGICEKLLAHPGFREGEHWKRLYFSANEDIISEGDNGREVFLLQRGTVRVTGSVQLQKGSAIHPGFCDLTDNAVFGEFGLLSRNQRSASVCSVSDCEIIVMDGSRLLEFFEHQPEMGYRFLLELLENSARRLDQTNRKLLKMLAWGLQARNLDSCLSGT